MNRAPDGRSFTEWNDEMVERYDPGLYHERSSRLIRAIEKKRTRVIVRLLDARRHQRVLEVGVGAGNVLERIAAGSPLGLDLSMRLLRDARRRLGPGAALIRGDAAALPIASRSIDRVVCSEVLEHLPDPSAALSEIARVVRDDGIVVLSVPNEALIDAVKRFLQRTRLLALFSSSSYRIPVAMKDEWHLHEFDLSLLRKFVEPHLRLERVVGVPAGFLPVRYVARCLPVSRS